MLSCVLALVFQSKTLDYSISQGGKVMGEAKVVIKITQDGGKRTDSKLTLKIDGKTLDMHTTQVWAFSCRPTMKIVQTFDAKGVEVSRTRIDFTQDAAMVSQTVNGKITRTKVPIPANAQTRDLSEFWFLRDEPLQGKPFECVTFNATTLKWEKSKSTYIGETEKNVLGKKTKLRSISQVIGDRKIDILVSLDGFPITSTTSEGTKITVKS